ncbi:MAG: DNA polymerase III subunit delta' [Sphingosinicella sp.]
MTSIFGHQQAIAEFRAQLDGSRMHHAWLITGPAGVGKALFALQAALRLLADGDPAVAALPALEVPEKHPAASLVAAESHPDFTLLARLPKEEGGELARGIKIDQVRSLQRLFATHPSISKWRAVVIDGAEVLEAGAANALLKNLEEPPAHTVFLIVSHAPDRIMPTIRSRCRFLRLGPLADDDMRSALQAALPDANEGEIARLVREGEGRPGTALAMRHLDGAAIDRELRSLAERGDRDNRLRSALALPMSTKSNQARYEALLARVPTFIAGEAKKRRGAALDQALTLWRQASELAAKARAHSLEPQSTTFVIAGLVAELAPSRLAEPQDRWG